MKDDYDTLNLACKGGLIISQRENESWIHFLLANDIYIYIYIWTTSTKGRWHQISVRCDLNPITRFEPLGWGRFVFFLTPLIWWVLLIDLVRSNDHQWLYRGGGRVQVIPHVPNGKIQQLKKY